LSSSILGPDSTEASHSMSEESSNAKRLNMLVEEAAGVVAASRQKIGFRHAMELVGFHADEITHSSTYKRVTRRAKALIALATSTVAVASMVPPVAVVRIVNTNVSNVSTLTPPTVDMPIDAAVGVVVPPPEETATMPAKKYRRTVKELNRYHSKQNAAKVKHKLAMKAATTRIKHSRELPMGHPNRKSVRVIVEEVNEAYNSNVSMRTAAAHVTKGWVGWSPQKPGPVGDFPKVIYEALKGAFATYLKLEQAGCKKQSTIKQLVQIVNATVNAGGFTKTDDNLTRKLRKDTAEQFEVGKANVIEQRRLLWTTSYNLDMWYTTWKKTLIDLGFAREKLASDDTEGEVVFHPGQLDRIVNFDETDGSIDDTTGKRGGRPGLTFYSREVTGGATAANKSSTSATIIFGSSAAGEPLPPHFQLKTTAQTAEAQRMSTAWFRNTHSILVKFGFDSKQERPCTFGMNEKAGMNSEELNKYIANSIIPLYPDLEDRPGKRLLLKVDSGPGRNNLEMLADLRLQGVYLVPGVPNTTAVTQETDQNYGPFKGAFRGNIRQLSQHRFENKKTLRITDLPLLIFGGLCEETGTTMENSFQEAFAHDSNLSGWAKCGAVPLTRVAMKSNKVRHEVPVFNALIPQEGLTSTDTPEIRKLVELEEMNGRYCNILTANGFAGDFLRMAAPKRKKVVAVSQPNTLERQEALRNASSAGKTFHATGGGHLNSDDYFKAAELKARANKLKAMEEVKKEREKYCKDQWAALRLIKAKGELTWDTVSRFTIFEIKILLKWKKVKATGTKKRDLVEAYTDAPKPIIQPMWKRSEQAKLDALKDTNVSLESTALGAAAKKMVKNLQNSMGNLDAEALKELEAIIQARRELENPNAL
jgi:hypothetical protein